MKTFSILILVSFFSTNLLDKAESVKLELKTFDEIFGEGWWDKGEAEDLKTPAPTNFGQNVHHQIDRQNTQIGQIEPNSTDQNPPLTDYDHSGQIEPNSTDQNPPLTESDHFDNVNNGEEINSNENIAENERKRKIVAKFHMKADLKRDGFKNSYPNQIYKTVAKELGLSLATIYKWKHKLGQTTSKHIYSNSEQKELMKCYYEIKDKTHKIKDEEIAKMLKIGIATLYRWKKKFERHQLLPNSVVGHSVEENAAANIQEIGHSNSGSI
uniref:Transposase n=1 Tax=Globodera rostochiensis TaxID=31243 RepID=A0A914HPA9_GLORO